jgi:AcrR family transcriptional regulator
MTKTVINSRQAAGPRAGRGRRHDPARHDAVRRRIFEAARRRIERYGYRHTTIEEIAGDAGVAKGTVYLYFPGKEDLVVAIVSQMLERLEARMRASARGRGTAASRLERLLLERVLHFRGECRRAPEGYALIHVMEGPLFERAVRGHIVTHEAIVAGLVAEAVAAGEFAAVDPNGAARAMLVAFHALQGPGFLMGDRASLVHLAESLAHLLVQGLRHGVARPTAGGRRGPHAPSGRHAGKGGRP